MFEKSRGMTIENFAQPSRSGTRGTEQEHESGCSNNRPGPIFDHALAAFRETRPASRETTATVRVRVIILTNQSGIGRGLFTEVAVAWRIGASSSQCLSV